MDVAKKMMEKWGWEKGQGLGKDNKGMTSCLILKKTEGSVSQGRIEMSNNIMHDEKAPHTDIAYGEGSKLGVGASPSSSSTSNASETKFLVIADKSTGTPLGINVNDTPDKTALLVEAISGTPGALMTVWNLQNPLMALRVGDHLLAVNGHRGKAADLMAEIKKPQRLEMLVSRRIIKREDGEFTIAADKSTGQPLGLNVNDTPDKTALVVEHVSDDKNSLVAQWNAANPGKTIRKGDRIVAVNEKRGVSSELLAEVKKPQLLEISVVRKKEEEKDTAFTDLQAAADAAAATILQAIGPDGMLVEDGSEPAAKRRRSKWEGDQDGPLLEEVEFAAPQQIKPASSFPLPPLGSRIKRKPQTFGAWQPPSWMQRPDWRWSKGTEATRAFQEMPIPRGREPVAHKIFGDTSRYPGRIADDTDCAATLTAWGTVLVRPRGTGAKLALACQMVFKVLHPRGGGIEADVLMTPDEMAEAARLAQEIIGVDENELVGPAAGRAFLKKTIGLGGEEEAKKIQSMKKEEVNLATSEDVALVRNHIEDICTSARVVATLDDACLAIQGPEDAVDRATALVRTLIDTGEWVALQEGFVLSEETRSKRRDAEGPSEQILIKVAEGPATTLISQHLKAMERAAECDAIKLTSKPVSGKRTLMVDGSRKSHERVKLMVKELITKGESKMLSKSLGVSRTARGGTSTVLTGASTVGQAKTALAGVAPGDGDHDAAMTALLGELEADETVANDASPRLRAKASVLPAQNPLPGSMKEDDADTSFANTLVKVEVKTEEGEESFPPKPPGLSAAPSSRVAALPGAGMRLAPGPKLNIEGWAQTAAKSEDLFSSLPAPAFPAALAQRSSDVAPGTGSAEAAVAAAEAAVMAAITAMRDPPKLYLPAIPPIMVPPPMLVEVKDEDLPAIPPIMMPPIPVPMQVVEVKDETTPMTDQEKQQENDLLLLMTQQQNSQPPPPPSVPMDGIVE